MHRSFFTSKYFFLFRTVTWDERFKLFRPHQSWLVMKTCEWRNKNSAAPNFRSFSSKKLIFRRWYFISTYFFLGLFFYSDGFAFLFCVGSRMLKFRRWTERGPIQKMYAKHFVSPTITYQLLSEKSMNHSSLTVT